MNLINMPRAAWRRSPTRRVRVNTGSGHPYAPHLLHAFVFNPENGFVDAVTGERAVVSGTPSYYADWYGVGVGGFSAANFITLPYVDVSSGGQYTHVLVQRNLTTANTGGHVFGGGTSITHMPFSGSDYYIAFSSTRRSTPLPNTEAIYPRTLLVQSGTASAGNSYGAAVKNTNNYFSQNGTGSNLADWSGSPIIGKWNDSWTYNGVVYACLIFKTGDSINFIDDPVSPEINEILDHWWLFLSADYNRKYFIPSDVAATIPTLSAPGVTEIGSTSVRPQITLTF